MGGQDGTVGVVADIRLLRLDRSARTLVYSCCYSYKVIEDI